MSLSAAMAIPAVAPAAAGRELGFSADDFQRVRTLIRAKAGIDLHPGKQNLVYGRLARRLRERGHGSFRSYLDALQGDSGPEWQEFINCLTTNLTAFFREAHHFEMLAAQLQRLQGPVRIWSCAASTGEEPYSIAMTAVEAMGENPPVRVDASDVDTQVLATARAAVYAADSGAAVGEARLKRFFLRGKGPNAGKVRLRPELRSLVAFRSFNLLSAQWESNAYEAIFCRNVMIYFDKATQRRVLEQLHGSLKAGGLLFAGHAENFIDHRDLFELAGRTVYVRAG